MLTSVRRVSLMTTTSLSRHFCTSEVLTSSSFSSGVPPTCQRNFSSSDNGRLCIIAAKHREVKRWRAGGFESYSEHRLSRGASIATHLAPCNGLPFPPPSPLLVGLVYSQVNSTKSSGSMLFKTQEPELHALY